MNTSSKQSLFAWLYNTSTLSINYRYFMINYVIYLPLANLTKMGL